METEANHSRIGGEGGRLVCDGALERFANVVQFVNFAVEVAQQRAASCRRGRNEVSQYGELRQRFAERHQFARASLAKSDAAGQAFEILNTAKLLADFTAHHGLLDKMADGVEALVDGAAVNQGTENP